MGVRQAAVANIAITIAKLAPIFIFIVALLVAFNLPAFSFDFWGASTPTLGSILDQVKSTMLVTLWVFIGIEGASVESGRAESRADIGKATLLGYLTALAAYVLVSLLSFGVMSQGELAGLPTAASMANVLDKAVGPWGSVLIRLGLVVSVVGAFLSWTLFAAEIPYRAARGGVMPDVFATENAKGSPAGALWITNILVQAFLLLTLYSNATYLALFYISATAILVPYVLSGAYALKLAFTESGKTRTGLSDGLLVVGLIATVYGIWLVYAAGPQYLMMAALLYAPGILFYWRARNARGETAFKPFEAVVAILLVITAGAAAYLMWTGQISAV
jgi:arginine:ornithine antiporter / lysine permease